MSLQEWVAKAILKTDGAKRPSSAVVEGAHGIRISRAGRRDVVVYCPDPDPAPPFGPADLDEAISEVPDMEFLVIVRRRVQNSLYDHADTLGMPVYGLGELGSALRSSERISNHLSGEDRYVRSRLDSHRSISNYRRLGQTTFLISTRGEAGSVIAAMVDDYEVTADRVVDIANTHPEFALDAVVATSPNCRGFASPTLKAATVADVKVMTFADFLKMVRRL